jgi:hypothetical protein
MTMATVKFRLDMVKSRTHLVIPDCQVRPGVDISHMGWIGNYIAEKRPNVIVCLGDFADMASLNGYGVGKASAEGKRYVDDLASVRTAMDKLTKPWRKRYSPKQVMTLGNHEDRITREAEANPKFVGALSVSDLDYESFGWDQYQFLRVVEIDRVSYSHYFTSGVMGRPVSSAAALLRTRHASSVMGHVQMLDLAIHPKTQHIGLFAGLCTLHNENYLGPQGNDTKRGIWMLHEVHDGTFDPMFVSLGFLKRRYS